jgi:predicted amidohydrolase
MSQRIVVAACAPASYGFVAPEHNRVTERIIQGRERSLKRIREHVARMLEHHARILRRAGGAGATVAVIPEDCTRLAGLVSRHHRDRSCASAVAEAFELYRETMAGICRESRMFVVGGTMTWRRGRFYNTAVMQDPAGEVVAAYDKTHLPCNGEHACVAPGRDLPVFETPIGKVGLLICWDIVFPETYAVLALKGAEVVFQPTFGHWEEWSDVMARARAMDWSVPLVVSMWGGCACIIDQDGNFAARTGRVPDSLAVAPLEIGAKRRFVYLEDARLQKPRERRPELYERLVRRPRPSRSVR